MTVHISVCIVHAENMSSTTLPPILYCPVLSCPVLLMTHYHYQPLSYSCPVLFCSFLFIMHYLYVCIIYVSDELLREDSEVKKIFGGQLRSQLVCPDCAKVTVYFEYHRSVSHLTLLYLYLCEIKSIIIAVS